MENDFRSLDLNLLVVFNALMRERHVSKAADTLFLGQPAVSNSLARLRLLLKDELFIRTGGGMVPTNRAKELHQLLMPALSMIHSAIFEPPLFDPLTDNRIFTLGMRDWVESWIMPILLQELEKVAPNIRLRVQVADDSLAATLIENDSIDFAITNYLEGPKWLKVHSLAETDYMAVYDTSSLPSDKPITLNDFISLPHLLTSTKGAFAGEIDRLLEGMGHARNVIYTTTRFNALPQILKQMKAIATIPEPLAKDWEKYFNLKTSKLPFKLEPFSLTLSHHDKYSNDQAFIWMAKLIKTLTDPQ